MAFFYAPDKEVSDVFPACCRRYPPFSASSCASGIICLVMGLLCFLIGEMMPAQELRLSRLSLSPCHAWERNGDVYLKLGINRWKDKVPDMSRYIPHTFRKKIGVMRSPEHVEGLIRETCVAELVHVGTHPLEPRVPRAAAPAAGTGSACCSIDIFGNLPFILIQRYNRPRLVILLERQREVQAMQAAKRAARALS